MIPMSKTLSLELLCLICLASKLNGCGARVRKQTLLFGRNSDVHLITHTSTDNVVHSGIGIASWVMSYNSQSYWFPNCSIKLASFSS